VTGGAVAGGAVAGGAVAGGIVATGTTTAGNVVRGTVMVETTGGVLTTVDGLTATFSTAVLAGAAPVPRDSAVATAAISTTLEPAAAISRFLCVAAFWEGGAAAPSVGLDARPNCAGPGLTRSPISTAQIGQCEDCPVIS
jgi:hypothetical protein